MKVGDLVEPLISCSGEPGYTRCKIAIVIGRTRALAGRAVEILCPCGVSKQYSSTLTLVKKINEITLS